jgi:hypothetical protein
MAHSQWRWPTEAATLLEATFTHAKTHINPGAGFRPFEPSAMYPIDMSQDMPFTDVQLREGIAITLVQRGLAHFHHTLNPIAAALE